jgi:cob(I)alamin adenosyltransferase
MIQVYYGEGHGKSTAALGIAIQAACNGKSVIAIQFLKGKLENEKEYLTRLEPEIKFFRFAKSDVCFDELSEEEQNEERINLKNGFNYGKKVIATGACDMVVLDEFLGLVDQKIITVEDIREMISVKPEDMTLILTGRVLTDEIRQMADEIYNIAPEK